MTINEAEVKITVLENDLKQIEDRLSRVEHMQSDLNKMAIAIEKMSASLEFQSNRLNAIEESMASKNKAIFGAITSAVIGGLLGYLINILLK